MNASSGRSKTPVTRKRTTRSSAGYTLERSDILLAPDSAKVVIQPFGEGDMDAQQRYVRRILDLSGKDAQRQLAEVVDEFDGRHPNLCGLLMERFHQVSKRLNLPEEALSETQCLLIGSFFLSEYALESAALFNPSIVPHPNQSGVPKACMRVIVSLRATGEGHISSIEFRTGIVDGEGNLVIDPAVDCVSAPLRCDNPAHKKSVFKRRLEELEETHKVVDAILGRLNSTFSHAELNEAIARSRAEIGPWGRAEEEVANQLRFLAECNYVIRFPSSTPLSQHVIFPQSPSERQGIEDARFVRFQNDGRGDDIYYATYTAWNGRVTLPQIIETYDFSLFRLGTLSGRVATNKGMAFFPRKVKGTYATLARSDGVNLYLAYSDDIYHWDSAEILAKPIYSWELFKIGNCGSPMETDEGWLVLTHGVGAMRKYCIGAMLLDLDDPSRVIGRLKEPLLKPNENERVGYVPNVVYTCGALIHNGWAIIPYAMSDYAVTAAKVKLDELLAALRSENA